MIRWIVDIIREVRNGTGPASIQMESFKFYVGNKYEWLNVWYYPETKEFKIKLL